MNPRVKALADKIASIRTTMQSMIDTAEREDRDFTPEENETFAALKAEHISLENRKARIEELLVEAAKPENLKTGEGLTLPDPAKAAIKTKECFVDDPKRGIKSHTEFLLSVMHASRRGRIDDPRLQYLSGLRTKFLATAGSDEQGSYSDPAGGFLVPAGFSPNMLTVPADAQDQGIVTTRVPMTTPSVTFNARVDKDHSTSVSGGLTVSRRAETGTMTGTRMLFEQVTIKADSLYGLAFATNKLLQDSPQSFVAMLQMGFNDQFMWHMVGERIEGTGVGEYLGVRNSPCFQSIAKETGQAADTIVFNNIAKMRARCWNYARAVWHYNQDCLPTLMTMTIPVGTGGILAWQTSAREGEPDLFFGRPAYPCEHCETVGDAGDILLCVWSEYLEGIYQAMDMAESIHVRFLENEQAFRFTMRCGGAPWWRSYLTPKNGTNYLSPFNGLAARA